MMVNVERAPHHLVRLAFMATLVVGATACGVIPVPGAGGPCELVVHASENGKDVILEPPYHTRLDDRQVEDDVGIGFSGSGWGQIRVDMAGPGKSVSGTMGAGTMVIGESGFPNHVWFANAPGTWHFRLASGPCVRVLDVEVAPANP